MPPKKAVPSGSTPAPAGSSPANPLDLELSSSSEDEFPPLEKWRAFKGFKGGKNPKTPGKKGAKEPAPTKKTAPAPPGTKETAPAPLGTKEAAPGSGDNPPAPPGPNTGDQNAPNLLLGTLICSRDDPYDHLRPLPNDNTGLVLPNENATVGNIDSVHQLQVNMQSWVRDSAITTALDTLDQRILPPALQQRGMVLVNNWADALFFQLGTPEADAAFEARLQNVRINEMTGRITRQGQLHNIRRHAWSVLTVNINNSHWITVIIHLAGAPDQFTPNQYYSRVSRIFIINGFDNGDTERVYQRLERILQHCGLEFPAPLNADNGTPNARPNNRLWRRTIWSPPQTDITSCGVQAYVNVKNFLGRLVHAWEMQADQTRAPSVFPEVLGASAVDDRNDNEILFSAPMPGWFNYELERWEMIGVNAGAVVRNCEYEARVAIEVVTQQNAGRGGIPLAAGGAINVPAKPTEADYAAWPEDFKKTLRFEAARQKQAGKGQGGQGQGKGWQVQGRPGQGGQEHGRPGKDGQGNAPATPRPNPPNPPAVSWTHADTPLTTRRRRPGLREAIEEAVSPPPRQQQGNSPGNSDGAAGSRLHPLWERYNVGNIVTFSKKRRLDGTSTSSWTLSRGPKTMDVMDWYR